MNVLDRWNNYWFRPSPYFDLALLRIAAVGLQCYLLFSHVFGDVLNANQLPDSLFHPLPMLQILMVPWGSMVQPDPDVMMALFWVVAAFGIASLLGFLTNISLSILAVGYIFIQAYNYSFGDIHHPQAIMVVFLLALSFSPCGKVLSIDAFIRSRRIRGGRTVKILEYSGKDAYWPIGLIQWFFPLMYLSAVISKVSRSGMEWANGFTLQYALIQDGYRFDSDLAIWLSQFHYFIVAVEWIVLLFQTTFVLILFFPKLRWIYLPVGLCFHLGIYFTLVAPFPQWILLYAVYVPWSRVFRWLATRQVAVRDPAVA